MSYHNRPLRAEDLEQAWNLDLQIFNGDVQLFRSDARYRKAFEARGDLDRFHGVFDDKGRLAAMARVLPLGQHFGGRRVSMGGLSTVGVAPEARGQGLAASAVGAALEDMRAHGEVISTLHPATAALYRKLGWELSGAYVLRHVDCQALRQLPVPRARRLERAAPEDLPRIRACYERVAPTINGFLDRSDAIWCFLEDFFDEFFVYLSLDPAGEVDGYVAYTQGPPQAGEHGFTIRVRDWIAESRTALLALFWSLGSASTVTGVVRYPSSPEDPLLLLLEDQVERVYHDVRLMTRIVDPEGAVRQRGFAAALDLEVPFVLEECGGPAEPLSGNAGAYLLSLSGGGGQLERIAKAPSDAPRLTVAAFASLYTGWAGAALLERTGLLCGGSRDHRAALDAAFAGPTPWLLQEF